MNGKKIEKSWAGAAAMAGAAIGSAAVAAAAMYVTRRKERKESRTIPTGEAPETD